MTDRRVYMANRRRPWTPERVKRECNGCGAVLGDATGDEINAAACGCIDPPDVRGECPYCSPRKE